MNAQIYNENSSHEKTFWGNATKYASIATDDEQFVGEIAYMLVTLHRTGS